MDYVLWDTETTMERKVSITDRRVSGAGHPDCKKVFGYERKGVW